MRDNRTVMNDENVREEIVTKFLHDTCRLRSKLHKPAVQAAMYCTMEATVHPTNDAETSGVPLITGSVAEFYVEPMLPHVGDIDVMFHLNTELAIPRGQSPPTQLPAEFNSSVEVFDIVDSHLPGYVYLESRYLLTECVDDEDYNVEDSDEQMCLMNRRYDVDECEIHGPAVIFEETSRLLAQDTVPCMRCLSWPPQAADWPTRDRNYGWPESATVDRVVSNGCDVVGVPHRQCRQDERVRHIQHRLSFSRAEIVLINSWIPVQQIVYHMLRVFVKAERLTADADDFETSELSNYHVKTTMLWECERMPERWWSEDISLVGICAELLHKLATCLSEARCPHYFVNDCNLIDSPCKSIARRLKSISKSRLSSWFVNNYMRECSELCPLYVSRLFDDVSTTIKLQNAASAIVAWRLDTTLLEKVNVFEYAQNCISFTVSALSLTLRSLHYWLSEFAEISTSLSLYFIAISFLHFAHKISRNDFGDELMDVLAALVRQSVDAGRYSIQRGSEYFLSKATRLMKAVAKDTVSNMQLIEIELSKAYLYRALRCKDISSIYCLANVYLAVLFYATGQYQTAMDHCTLVTRSHDHSWCGSHVVQGELLPKMDADFHNMLGLAVLYQHVVTSALKRQRKQHVTVITTEICACFLHIKCMSITQCQTHQFQLSTYEVPTCVRSISDTRQLHVVDILLLKSTNAFSKHLLLSRQEFHGCPTELDSSQLVELLQRSGVELLTTFSHLKARDFDSVVTIVTTDFEALYAYKRGDYRRCLRLSMQSVRSLSSADFVIEVLIFPEFVQLLDDDIVSLTALTLIVDARCRDDSHFTSVNQLTLSLYLTTQCQLKLRHSVTSLTRTLQNIKVAQRRNLVDRTLDQLTLKLAARLIIGHLRTLHISK